MAKFVQLIGGTTGNPFPIWIDPTKVAAVYEKGNGTAVQFAGGDAVSVNEAPADVARQIAEAVGDHETPSESIRRHTNIVSQP